MAVTTSILSSKLIDVRSVSALAGNAQTRTYRVVAEIKNGTTIVDPDTELVLSANAAATVKSFPCKATVHPYDAAKACTSVDVQAVPDTRGVGGNNHASQYIITATYETMRTGNEILSPLSRAPVVKVRGWIEQYYDGTDAEGKPYANSAGDAVTGTPPKYRRGIMVNIQWNTEDSPAALNSYQKAVNNGTWREQAEETVLVDDFSADYMQDQDYAGTLVKYWQCTISLIICPDGFRRYTPDQGYGHLDGEGNPVQNVDSANVPIATPLYLDGAGGLLNGTGLIGESGEAVNFPGDGYIEYVPTDFTGLDIPNVDFDLSLTPPAP